MWWNSGPHLRRRMQMEKGETVHQPGKGALRRASTSFFQRDTVVEEFVAVLESKFGSITRAWRVGLDEDGSGSLDFREFCNATRQLGYVGNLRTLWFNLDTDSSGSVGLKELDPVACAALEKFRAKCTTGYGTMRAMWDTLLDQDRSGTVSHAEFVEHAGGLGYGDPAELWDLFRLLVVQPGCRCIRMEDLEFLQKWEDAKKARAHRKRIPSSWVNADPYIHGGGSTLPSLSMPDEFEAVVAFDEEKTKDDFRQFLIGKYGSLPRAFDIMDANGSGSLSLVEFQAVVATVLRYCRPADARRLFLSFNQDPGAMLTWDELGITSPEWINFTMAKRNERRKREAQALANATAPLGASPRMQGASSRHVGRLREATGPASPRAIDVAFSAPLPRGWGPPPDFRPAMVMSAR